MKSPKFLHNQKGFSLVELMIVVGIIGVLATLALPRFKQFQAKAKMGEAKNILSHIYTLEQSYALDTNAYVGFAVVGRLAAGTINCTFTGNPALIGFRIDPCPPGAPATAPTPRYGYSVASGAADVFVATAATGALANNKVCPGNAAHTYTLDQANVLVEPVGGVGAVCAN